MPYFECEPDVNFEHEPEVIGCLWEGSALQRMNGEGKEALRNMLVAVGILPN